MKSVVIVAAGASSRYGANKLNEVIVGKTVLERAVDAFRHIADEIIVVGECSIEGVKTVSGGQTRFQSVANGLNAVSEHCNIVAIHDGARPYVSRELINTLFNACEKHGSAIPRLPMTDTIWRQADGKLMKIDRNELFAVQTPQVFDCSRLKQAFANATSEYTDESALYYDTFGEVHFVNGERGNSKITYREDLHEFRVGTGFDVHAFGTGDGIILGGIKVPYKYKLIGHSDADVLCHAISDAVLSASGEHDIGWQFPDTDSQYKGADSCLLLARCVNIAKQRGFAVVNVSAVIICQQPKLAPYIDAMSERLAGILEVDGDCVNLSATTTEHLGALGNGDGVACQAQALLRRI